MVVGIVFLGLAGAWLLREADVIDPDGFQWFLPVVLLGAGLAGLLAGLANGAFARRKPSDELTEVPTGYPDDTPVPVTDLTSDLDRRLEDLEHQQKKTGEDK
jgi:hypothetical protein